MSDLKYVLITAAKNEEDYIEKTIISVVAQKVLPEKWVIISDGSTDKTDKIVQSYVDKHPFITLLRAGGEEGYHFGSKVNAIKSGYALMDGLDYNYLGILDADVSFDEEYFESLLARAGQDPKLGICGGYIHEKIKGVFVPQTIHKSSIAGAVQFFHRKCWEQIGGLLPIKLGGEDAAAEISSRFNGWHTSTFYDLPVMHWRRVGRNNILNARLRQGKMFYVLGYHPIFFILMALRKIFNDPMIIGNIIMSWGFFGSYFGPEQRALPKEVVKFLQNEQLARLHLSKKKEHL